MHDDDQQQPDLVQLNVRVPEVLVAQLRAIAANQERSLAFVVRRACQKYIEEDARA